MEDDRIIRLLFSRSEEALAGLEQAYKKLCLSVAWGITGDEADAEECWNDTCLAVWNAIPPAHPASLKSYVLRILRNTALNRVKAGRTAKRSAILVELDECVSDHIPDREPDEIGPLIDAFLEGLPKKEAMIFMRRYFCSEAVGDIARQLGCTDNQISKILARLRRKLKKHLTEGGIAL